MTEPTRHVTISFTIPSALHLIVVVILTAAAIGAYALHFALSLDDPYRETAANIGNLAAFVAVGYCALCLGRRNRSDTADLHDITETAIQAAAERQAGIQSTIEAATAAILLSLREITEQMAEDRGNMKHLEEAVNAATEAIKEAAGDVIALQDCYLHEGQVLVIPAQTDAPHDSALTG